MESNVFNTGVEKDSFDLVSEPLDISAHSRLKNYVEHNTKFTYDRYGSNASSSIPSGGKKKN